MNTGNNLISLKIKVKAIFILEQATKIHERPDHDQKHCYHHAPTVKPEAITAVSELLMMGVSTPEACWAVHKRQVINLRNCCIWLVDLFEPDYSNLILYQNGYNFTSGSILNMNLASVRIYQQGEGLRRRPPVVQTQWNSWRRVLHNKGNRRQSSTHTSTLRSTKVLHTTSKLEA